MYQKIQLLIKRLQRRKKQKVEKSKKQETENKDHIVEYALVLHIRLIY